MSIRRTTATKPSSVATAVGADADAASTAGSLHARLKSVGTALPFNLNDRDHITYQFSGLTTPTSDVTPTAWQEAIAAAPFDLVALGMKAGLDWDGAYQMDFGLGAAGAEVVAGVRIFASVTFGGGELPLAREFTWFPIAPRLLIPSGSRLAVRTLRVGASWATANNVGDRFRLVCAPLNP